MYKYLIFCGQFALVVVTSGGNFMDLYAHYFQNLRECLAADVYPGLSLENRPKETVLI